jgi:hypothetical protein
MGITPTNTFQVGVVEVTHEETSLQSAGGLGQLVPPRRLAAAQPQLSCGAARTSVGTRRSRLDTTVKLTAIRPGPDESPAGTRNLLKSRSQTKCKPRCIFRLFITRYPHSVREACHHSAKNLEWAALVPFCFHRSWVLYNIAYAYKCRKYEGFTSNGDVLGLAAAMDPRVFIEGSHR